MVSKWERKWQQVVHGLKDLLFRWSSASVIIIIIITIIITVKFALHYEFTESSRLRNAIIDCHKEYCMKPILLRPPVPALPLSIYNRPNRRCFGKPQHQSNSCEYPCSAYRGNGGSGRRAVSPGAGHVVVDLYYRGYQGLGYPALAIKLLDCSTNLIAQHPP